MKKANIEMGVLIAVAAIAAIGALFMFTNSEPSAMASYDPQFTPQQTDCLMSCYEQIRQDDIAGIQPSREKLARCINFCQTLQ